MKLKIKNNLGMPIADATVMVTDAPVPIHDIAAMTDNNGAVNLADYDVPGSYTVTISHDGQNSSRVVEVHEADEVIAVSV
jgi:carboxypeptidase family protein